MFRFTTQSRCLFENDFSSNFDMITARTTKSEINLWIGSRDQASRVTDVRKYVIKIVFLRKAEAVVIV